MIVIGNSRFATGMKLAGLRNTHVAEDKDSIRKAVSSIEPGELVVANTSVVELEPSLKELDNLVTIPDQVEQFQSAEDLKEIVKSAIGFEPKLE